MKPRSLTDCVNIRPINLGGVGRIAGVAENHAIANMTGIIILAYMACAPEF